MVGAMSGPAQVLRDFFQHRRLTGAITESLTIRFFTRKRTA